jgi:hypothetical protein
MSRAGHGGDAASASGATRESHKHGVIHSVQD